MFAQKLVWRLSAVVAALAVIAAAVLGVVFRPAAPYAWRAALLRTTSKAFFSQLDPKTLFAETTGREGIRRLRHLMTFDLNRAARTVEVTVLGRFHGHFIFREGFGCVLQHGSATPYLPAAARTPKGSALLPEIAGSEVVEPTDPALKAAIDRLTAVPAHQG